MVQPEMGRSGSNPAAASTAGNILSTPGLPEGVHDPVSRGAVRRQLQSEEPTVAQPLRNRLLRHATKCHTCTRRVGERASIVGPSLPGCGDRCSVASGRFRVDLGHAMLGQVLEQLTSVRRR
jgi:hypothetical protein